MPTPPTSKRLLTLIPEEVALDAAMRVARTVERLAWQLAPGVTVHQGAAEPEHLQASQVYLSVLDLVHYAQRGGADEELEDLMLSVLGVFATAPLDVLRGEAPVPAVLVSELDEADPLSLVCIAAWARYQVSRGERINGDQLAALAGLSPARIRALRDAGELRAATEPERKVGTLYAAKEVRRFLSGRGVHPFAPTVTLSAGALERLVELTESPPAPTAAAEAKRRGGK